MKLKLFLVSLAIACLLVPQYAGAATVLEETGFIFGFGGENYSFVADETPEVYQLTLTDFEFPAAFDFLGVAITTSTDKVAELLAPGITTFDVVLGTTYFVNVLGNAADPPGAGLFGVEITAIPIPPSLILLGTSVFGLILLRRRVR
jgi:hypothetical protein